MAEIERLETDIEEIKLARQLKVNYCDDSGKETQPQKAAEIFHKIGLLYKKKSPDKIALIKSAGLLNAAVIRNPSNVSQIKSDLYELCQHILQNANARQQNVDLIKKAQTVKIKINEMREEVKSFLQTSLPKIPENASEHETQKLKRHKISAIQTINKLIANKYKNIMVELSQFCEDVMGEPPCQYAIVGMGSLAREEITPYSDFEHIILLFDDKNYESYLEYFKLFSVIFHVIVLNVQETIVPGLNIYSLNDKTSALGDWYYDAVTPRGISFDGMMPHACKFPLGRQQHTTNKAFTTELIKPVSEMLEYLTSEADLKHGYHLADILTKTCFVFGNEDIYNQFVNRAQQYRDTKSQTDNIFDIKQQVKDDLDNFSTRFRLTNLKSQDKINIKQLVYRSTTLFISALGRKHNISANSSFDAINEMAKHNKITQNTADKLRNAIAIACEIRLRVYVNNKSQRDNAIDLTHDGIEKFLEIVGVARTINYFQIAYCLQCELAKQLNFTKLHFYSNPQLINITIGLAFGLEMSGLSSFSSDSQSQSWDVRKFDFDGCIKKLETEKMVHSPVSDSQFSLNAGQIKSVTKYLVSAKVFDEALEFNKQLLDIYESKSKDVDCDSNVAWANNQIGYCLDRTKRDDEALEYYLRSLRIKENISSNPDKDWQIALTLENIGRSQLNQRHYDEAFTYLNRALKIANNNTNNPDKDRDISKILVTIARCHIDLHNYDEGIKNLNRALEINHNTTQNADKDRNIATTLHTIGRCQMDLQNHNEALKSFFRALTIKQNITRNPETDEAIFWTVDAIARCHIALQNNDKALTNLNQALKIMQNLSFNPEKDNKIAMILDDIARCHMNLHNHEDAFTNLKAALEIKENQTLNPNKDRSIAKTLHMTGRCHIDLANYAEALSIFNRALEINQNATQNTATDISIAGLLDAISLCQIDLQNYDEALKNLKQALKIKENTELDQDKNRGLAATKRSIGRCLIGLQQYDESWNCLEHALSIFTNTTSNKAKDISIAHTYNRMGECLIAKEQYTEALAYLERAKEIYLTQSNPEKDGLFASALYQLSICLIKLQKYENALDCLKQSREIYRNFPSNEHITTKIETICLKIDECMISISH